MVLISCVKTDFEALSPESGGNHVGAVVQEKEKYNTAVVIYGASEGIDISNKLLSLYKGKTADPNISVSIESVGTTGLFSESNGRVAIAKTPEIWSYDNISPQDNPDNMDVVTLRFQRGTESATLEVLVVLDRNADDNSRVEYAYEAADTRATSFDYNQTCLGLGYDVLNSGYISTAGLKRNNPILDINKLNAAAVITQANDTGSSWKVETALSIDSLFSQLYVKSSVSATLGIFGGDVSVEYKSKRDGFQTNAYSKAICTHFVKDEWILGTLPATLRKYMSDDFVNQVNTASAANVLDYYGTHMLVRCYHGGHAEVSNSYYGSQLTTTQDINTSLNATIFAITNNNTVNKDSKYVEIRDKSYFYGETRGGSLSSFTGWDTFISRYPAWVTSIKAKPTLCGISNFDTCLVPVWQLAATINTTKAYAIKKEYDLRLARKQLQISTLHNYMVALDVGTQNKPPAGYEILYRGNKYGPSDTPPRVLDCNAGCNGKYIYIYYKLMDENSLRSVGMMNSVIEDIIVLRNSAAVPAGYTKINYDLNKGCGGDYLYLAYKKVNASSKTAISAMSHAKGGNTIINSDFGWSWINYSGTKERADLNKGAGGEYIFVSIKKEPFQLNK